MCPSRRLDDAAPLVARKVSNVRAVSWVLALTQRGTLRLRARRGSKVQIGVDSPVCHASFMTATLCQATGTPFALHAVKATRLPAVGAHTSHHVRESRCR